MKQKIECLICEEIKPLHRKLSLIKDDDEVLDFALYCVDCWNSIRKSVEKASGLIDEID